ncbi:MaoC family dehydratase [Pseudochelatococcus sp. G4_1912]|uniref:MaoC family dehydratase n=1 Tax=Pseudochelatococcus sp. G4_1912 TaxID=3114288 RepID=UPI0039C64003
MPAFVFEDFVSGTITTYGGHTLHTDDIITFASEYDAQPMHTDPEAAKHTFVGQLIASGWHTCAVTMRMFYDNVLAGSSSMGSPGVEEGSWVKPVLPGDTLSVRQTIGETRVSRSRPEVGLVNFIFDVVNQRDETVYRQSCWVMFGRRGTQGWSAPKVASPAELAPTPQAEAGAAEDRLALWFEDIVVGDVANIGTHRFSADYIINYAKAFDPQPFHTDPEAARQSQFGGLCASGWQTGAVWMKLMIHYQVKQAYRAAKAGLQMGRLGPSPGFRNLRWLRPVFADDVLTYRTKIIDTRTTASRPEWGIVSTLNTAENAKGEPVFSFEGAVFWERRKNN